MNQGCDRSSAGSRCTKGCETHPCRSTANEDYRRGLIETVREVEQLLDTGIHSVTVSNEKLWLI